MSPEPRQGRSRRRRRAPIAYTGSKPRDQVQPAPADIAAPDTAAPDLGTSKPPLVKPGQAKETWVDLDDLQDLLQHSELDCPPKSLPRVQRYLIRMLEENLKLNLSGIRDLQEATALHVVDSLFVWQCVAKPPRVILDIGSGNGFPGVAAASLWPKARVILVERRQKKSKAIATCARDVGLGNVECLTLDAGQLPALHPDLLGNIDLVLSRATATLTEIAKLAAPLLHKEGLLVQWKAVQVPEAERREYERQQRWLGLKSREDLIYILQALEPRPRRIVSALKI